MRNFDANANAIGKSCLGLLMVAFAATNLSLLFASSAEAATALFRGQLTYYANIGSDYVITHPKATAMSKSPKSTAVIGNTAPAARVQLPKSFVQFSTTYYCHGANCFSGYPVSGGYYQYVNGAANFSKSNPNGALTTTTLRFRTTKWVASPSAYQTPYGSGDPTPLSATTNCPRCPDPAQTVGYGNGQFGFSRGGEMKLTPGPNKFSGSMRLVYGPNSFFYQEIDKYSPVFFSAYGSFKNPPSSIPTVINESTSSGMVTRYRLTGAIPKRQGGVRSTTGMGAYVTAKAYYLHTAANWMTGMIYGWQPLGPYNTKVTHTGYDARTSKGVNGTLSLVRPRITHTYLSYPTANQLLKNYSAVGTWGLKVFLTPEPGAMLMLGAGILTLAGLTRLRRR
jgi:hypothetical protein